MDRNLPLKPTIGFLICLCLAIAVYFYYAPMLVRPPITQIFSDNKNNVWALLENQVIEIESAEDTVLSQYSLEKFGINNHVGQLIPLANGGYIINNGGQDYSILRNIGRYLRITEAEADNNADNGSLLKCNADFISCQPWGESSLVFTTGWSGLELSNRQVIINDTSRHRVLLVSKDGQVLDTLGGFQFPNHTVEDDDNIWIIDTNHWKIVALNINDNKLVRSGNEIKLADYSGISRRVDWPSIAYLDNGNWWVMVNDSGMAYPNIYRLNPDNTATQFAAQLEDSSAMLVANDHLYLGQYPQNRVWKFNLDVGNGTPLSNVNLANVNQQIDTKISQQTMQMRMIIAVTALIGFALLFFAIKKSKPVEVSKIVASHRINVDANVGKPKVTKKIVWINKTEAIIKKIKLFKWVFLIFLVLAVTTLVYPLVIISSFNAEKGVEVLFKAAWGYYIVGITIIAILIPYLWYLFNKIHKYQLGVSNSFLIIRLGQSKQANQIAGKDISYSNNSIYTNDKLIIFQTPKETFYEKEVFEANIVPILQQGKKLSGWGLWLVRLKNFEFAATCEAIMAPVGIFAVMYDLFSKI